MTFEPAQTLVEVDTLGAVVLSSYALIFGSLMLAPTDNSESFSGLVRAHNLVNLRLRLIGQSYARWRRQPQWGGERGR